MQAPRIFRSDWQVKLVKHMPVAEGVIRFWREGIPADEILGRVDYSVSLDAETARHEFTNVVCNFLRVSFVETGFRNN